MSSRASEDLDATDLVIVIGNDGARYDCPDIARLDHHLGKLRSLISGTGSRFPALAARYLADADLLLDRRLWLEAVATEPAGP